MRSGWLGPAIGALAGACLSSSLVQAGQVTLGIDENLSHGRPLDGADGWFQWNDPLASGDLIWFDVLIRGASEGKSAEAGQVTVSMELLGAAGGLVFDSLTSEAIDADARYWLFGNSVGAVAMDLGSGRYQFGDGPDNPPFAPVEAGDILARFVFEWHGAPNQLEAYQVSVYTDTADTFLLQDFVTTAPNWVANPVILAVPEPSTVALLVCGALALLRSRRCW